MMANNYIAPVNGKEDQNVIPKSGKLAFDVPLYYLETVTGVSYELAISYKSALLKEDYGTWAPEAPSNIIACGWGINTDNRIFVINKHPFKYGLYFNGAFYQLRKVSTEGLYIIYRTVTHSLFQIRFDTVNKYWCLFTEDGTEYVFGLNDALNGESGDYSAQTGTYAQASVEYTAVRQLISNPNAQGIPQNIHADNTICQTTGQTLFGTQNWVGPTMDIGAMTPKISSWNLSHIRDKFGNTIAFSYIHHISNFIGTDTSKTYSVASYLYRIATYCGSTLTEKITLSYDVKENVEYNIDFIATPRPNGNQQKFEKLYLKKITKYDIKYEGLKVKPSQWITDQTLLNTTLINRTSGIPKRQLNEIQFLAKDTADIQYTPSYIMTYYGDADGVSVGQAGFDDTTHLYFNSKTGALYGNLKAITYPSGEKREYKYTEHEINNVASHYVEMQTANSPPKIIQTPYGYYLVLKKVNDRTYCYIHTMTVSGWVPKLLWQAISDPNYDYDRMISYSENIVGMFAPPQQDIRVVGVWTRDREKDGEWIQKVGHPFPACSSNIYIDVSDYGAACIYRPSGASVEYLYYRATNDFGNTFEPTRSMALSNLIKEGTNYHFALKVLENKCVAFVMTKQSLLVPKPSWVTQENKYYDTFWLRIGGMRGDGSLLPVSNLGMPQLLQHSFVAPNPQAIAKTAAYYITGGKLEKIIGVDIIGNFAVLRYQCRGQTMWYYKGNTGSFNSLKDATNIGEWCQVLFHYNNFENYTYLYSGKMAEALVKERSRSATTWPNLTQSAIESNAQVTENGIVYSVHYYCSKIPDIEKYNAIFCTYLGGSASDLKIQTNDTDQLIACVMKDNMFAAFQAKLSDGAYGKKYMYYNVADGTWKNINTGNVSSPSTTYNSSAEYALKIIFYLGVTLSIVLFPFGLGTVSGIICTALSVGLIIAAEVTSSILQNSYKSSLNLEANYFGNRFINDGTTIWFRNIQQDRMTAIGSGTAYQPFDALSGGGIRGNIVNSKQQFGHVYDYVPFFTDQNKLYYRSLKNDAVGAPMPLGGLSSGCSDLYYDSEDNLTYAFEGYLMYTIDSSGSVKSAVPIPIQNVHFVDACCLLKESNNKYSIVISGANASFNKNTGNYSTPVPLSKLFIGSAFTYIDCALEVIQDGGTATQFYLFSGNHFELVQLNVAGQTFTVISRGSLEEYKSDLPFDKLDAVFAKQGTYYIRGNRYVKYNVAGVKSEEGRLGDGNMGEVCNPNDITLQFIPDVLTMYRASDGKFQVYSTVGGSLDDSVKNYAVDTVAFYTDPRCGNEPASITQYQYDTSRSSYSKATDSAVYTKVYVCTKE